MVQWYFPSLLRSKFCSTNSFSIFLLGNNICFLDFQHPSYEGEKEGEEEVPSPHYAGSSSSSFIETYPYFPAWQYDVMNPDGNAKACTKYSLARSGMFLNVQFLIFLNGF